MKKNFILILLVFFQTLVFSQDSKVMKIAKYINKDKWQDARELLDELDKNPKYKTDIDYWYVRTCYYRDAIATHIDSDKELYKIEIVEAKKSFQKLVEYDKTDASKSYSEYIPQFRKEIYNGQNETINKSSSNSKSASYKTEDNAKTVTLTQIGQGKTKDAAKYNALRNAIEKAFGTFISSNTTLLNDELVKDEIVSVSTGNIQNFEILSETQMPDGSYTSVLKATVSIGKLTTFCESKGISVEFKGGLFAANIKLQELNKKNEEEVMKNLYDIVNKIIIKKGIFDFSIVAEEPIKSDRGSYDEKWNVELNITSTVNENINSIVEILSSTLKELSLNEVDLKNYNDKHIEIYTLSWDGTTYYYRSIAPVEMLIKIICLDIPWAAGSFKIQNGISNFNFPYKHFVWRCDGDIDYALKNEGWSVGKTIFSFLAHNGIKWPDYGYGVNYTYDNICRIKEYNHVEHKHIYWLDQGYKPIIVNNIINLLNNKIVNKVHNVLTINELNKVSEYKVEPIK